MTRRTRSRRAGERDFPRSASVTTAALSRQWRSRYATVIGILQKNHDILNHLIQIGVKSIPKTELDQLGYRAGFVTSSGRQGRRTVCRCFDIVFIDTETRLSGLSIDTLPLFREA